MISKKHKTIFIHIEKTGGTSIEKKLGLFDELSRGVQDHRKLTYFEHMAKHAHKLSNLRYFIYCLKRGKIRKAFKYIKNIFDPELTMKEYETFYKFTFVRNTWSRIYSYHYNIMRDNHLKNIYGIDDKCSLNDFVKKHLDYVNFNQLDYIKDSKGNIPLNFIGRFENLHIDFKTICNELNIENSELPKLLMLKDKPNYVEHFDIETKELVLKIYKNEIDYFGFEF